MIKTLSILTILNVIQMVISLVIQLLFAIVLGADSERDILFIAMSIPVFLNTVLTASIGVVLTPAAVSYNNEEKFIFFNKVLFAIAIFTISICLLLFFVKSHIVNILAPGFDSPKKIITSNLLNFAFLIIPVQAATLVINSFWITINKVLFPTISIIAGNVLTITIILFFKEKFNAEYGMISYLLGYSLSFLFVLILYMAGNEKSKTNTKNYLRIGEFKLLLQSSAILILLIIINRSSGIIEGRIASKLENGTISYLRYSAFLVTFLVGITTTPIITSTYSDLCKYWVENRKDKVTLFMEKGLVMLAIICLTIIGVFILSLDELLLFIKGWSNFSTSQLIILSQYFKITIVSYFFLSLSSFLGRLFYISNNFLKGAVFDLILLFFYILSAYLLVECFGGVGLAIATVTNSVFALIGIYWTLSYKIHRLNFSPLFFISLLKVTFIWIASFLIPYFMKLFISDYFNPISIVSIKLIVYLSFLGFALYKTNLLIYFPFFLKFRKTLPKSL